MNSTSSSGRRRRSQSKTHSVNSGKVTRGKQRASSNFILLRQGVYLLAAIVLIWAMSFPVKYGIANVQYYKADHALMSWHKSTDNFSFESWQSAFLAITKATELQPLHPLYLEIQGKMLLWGLSLDDTHFVKPAQQNATTDQEIKATGSASSTTLASTKKTATTFTAQTLNVSIRNKVIKSVKGDSSSLNFTKDDLKNAALHTFEQNIRLRPVWANTWIDIAMSKWHLNQIDATFWTALDNAEKYGPYMPEVNLGLSTVYLAFWNTLNLEQKTKGLEQIKRTLLHRTNEEYSFDYRKAIIERVKMYNQQALFCYLLNSDKRLTHFTYRKTIKRLCQN